MLIVSGVGWKKGVVGHVSTGIDMASAAGRALQTRQTVVIDDIEKSPEFRYPPVLDEHDILSVLNTPLIVGEEVWGVFEVDAEAASAFSLRDKRFFETFARILGAGILRLQDAGSRKEAAERLVRNDMLMRELHHRVRNYFQIIMSLLSLKSGEVTTKRSRAAIRDVMDRIGAIALAHDMLVIRDGQQGVVRISEYISALVANIRRMSVTSRIETELEDHELRVDWVVPLGLILNELVTNSIKYAVPSNPDAPISISFHKDPATGEARLSIVDKGPGMNTTREGASGLRLVKALAAQISGRVDVDSSPEGTTVSVCFPLLV